MKIALYTLLLLSLLAFVLFYWTIEPPEQQSVSMPWQITVHDPQHSEVFDIVLNKTTLEQVRQQFGQLEGIALYQSSAGIFSLEAYFGKVSIGPLDARMIANLNASQQDMADMAEAAIKKVITDAGSQKWTLNDQAKREQSVRSIKSLTYVPGYSKLDEDFLRQRFGPPDTIETINETAEYWMYPERGLRILFDREGKEVFEYMAPAHFKQSINSGAG